MNETFDYNKIINEVEQRLENGLVLDEDRNFVTNWLKQLKNTNIPQMKEANAKLLNNYLEKNKLGHNEIDGTNYNEVKNGILSFLASYKDLLDEQKIQTLQSYTTILSNKSVTNEEKFQISQKYWSIRQNVYYKITCEQVKELILKKYNNDGKHKSYLYSLIEVLIDEEKPLDLRKKADIEIQNILKYEKEVGYVPSSRHKI